MSEGSSTIWFAWAASTLCGQVISIVRDAHKQKQAVANVRQAGQREMLDLTDKNQPEAARAVKK